MSLVVSYNNKYAITLLCLPLPRVRSSLYASVISLVGDEPLSGNSKHSQRLLDRIVELLLLQL